MNPQVANMVDAFPFQHINSPNKSSMILMVITPSSCLMFHPLQHAGLARRSPCTSWSSRWRDCGVSDGPALDGRPRPDTRVMSRKVAMPIERCWRANGRSAFADSGKTSLEISARHSGQTRGQRVSPNSGMSGKKDQLAS
jgi:hypothetical protein